MNDQSWKLLKEFGIEFEKGLTLDEIMKIEKIYEIKFPDSLRDFFMIALPTSKGFYNWRNTEEDNVKLIKEVMNRPLDDIAEMANEVYWCDDWGDEPETEEGIAQEVRKRLEYAPKLLPIYAHRYMPMVIDKNPPIISVHDIDVIYYGKDIEDYFDIEFGEKKQSTIEFENIKPIQFWTEIM